MHYAHSDFCLVLTAAMRGLEAVRRPENAARNKHTTQPTTMQLQQHTDYIRHKRNNTDRPIIMFHNTTPSYMAD